jgi:hypothetical protein
MGMTAVLACAAACLLTVALTGPVQTGVIGWLRARRSDIAIEPTPAGH